MEEFKLHEDLKLGVATASTQIEGGDTNNTWYKFSSEPGNVKDGTTSFIANDHYRRYKEDILLMKSLNVEIYRMSIEWSRIEPKQDVFNEEAMKHYIDEITFLKGNNIDVLVTLHHFSNPLWFDEMGGFLNKNCVAIFLKYVTYVVSHLKGLVDEYCTINEANIYATSCYLFGDWAPKVKSYPKAVKVMKNLALSHIAAYQEIKRIDVNTRVGFANHMVYWKPMRENHFLDKKIAKFCDKCFQKSLTEAMGRGRFHFPFAISNKHKGEYMDFFGMNYYTTNYLKGFKITTKEDTPKNDLGWEISSEALRALCLRFYKEYQKDIYITENGTCDKADAFRSLYIYDHLKAIADLSFVKRYYHWTFIDNFEWAQGESARFGLVGLDFRTQERTIRPSGYFYRDIIEKKMVTKEMLQKYFKNE